MSEAAFETSPKAPNPVADFLAVIGQRDDTRLLGKNALVGHQAVGREMVAPKFVTWALIVFGALEVPWVIYLIFYQQTQVQAYHLHLASVGLLAVCAFVCGWGAWCLHRRHRYAAAWLVAGATSTTYLALIVTLSPNLKAASVSPSTSLPLVLGVLALVAEISAVTILLRDEVDKYPRVLQVAAILLAIIAVVFVISTVAHYLDPQTTELVTRTRAMVVVLDVGESIGLLGAGLSSLYGKPRRTLVFSMVGGSLLICDAWLNVVIVGPGLPFESAIFYLVVGEIPSIILCVLAGRSASLKLGLRAHAA